jgi:prepilin-type N-terminal cleavage/methylation domain-containing protein
MNTFIKPGHHARGAGYSGFTLIELLIVVAIIAILAAIAVPNFLEAQTRAKVSRVHADMRSCATAIEAYLVDYNSYPLNGVLVADGSIQNPQYNGIGSPAHKFLNEAITTPVAYITSLPVDPFVAAYPVQDSWQPMYPRYFYTNFDWFTKVTQPTPPPVIAAKKKIYGTWVLAGAGPDRDRLDLSRDLHYDPTNGTVSDGDVIRSPNVTTR